MTEAEQLQLFRSIRNAPATILLLLMVRGAAMTGRDICRLTGYSDKTTTDALATLDALGFTQNNGRSAGWSLRSGQLALPLIHSLPDFGEKEIVKFTISPTTTAITDPQEEDKAAAEAAPPDRRIYDLLVSAGVGRRSPKMRELLAADLDPATVAAHINAHRGGVGLLIRKLLDRDPPPARRRENHIPEEYSHIIKR